MPQHASHRCQHSRILDPAVLNLVLHHRFAPRRNVIRIFPGIVGFRPRIHGKRPFQMPSLGPVLPCLKCQTHS